LGTEVRQRHEVARLAFLALGKAGVFHLPPHPWNRAEYSSC
jgi:hypothetical protein